MLRYGNGYATLSSPGARRERFELVTQGLRALRRIQTPRAERRGRARSDGAHEALVAPFGHGGRVVEAAAEWRRRAGARDVLAVGFLCCEAAREELRHIHGRVDHVVSDEDFLLVRFGKCVAA